MIPIVWKGCEDLKWSRGLDQCECKGDEGIGSRENGLITNLVVSYRFLK
jgi:hypothetical protein